mgnify:CR=1 FL=1
MGIAGHIAEPVIRIVTPVTLGIAHPVLKSPHLQQRAFAMDSTTSQGQLAARTPAEISSRLYSLAKKIDDRVDAGEPMSADMLHAIAQRIRSYAIRLRGASPPFA